MAKNGTLREIIQAWNNGWDEPYTTPNGSLYHEDGILFSYGSHFPMAVKAVAGYVIANGDRYSNSTNKHQAYLFREVSDHKRVEIPYSALERVINKGNHGSFRLGYGFNPKELEKIIVHDNMGDTWIDTGRVSEDGEKIEQHVLGACVFEFEGAFYISGMDETGLGVHQYFLTELVDKVSSVAEALELMKPLEVREAEKEGKEVLRQGEWFFIKMSETQNNMINADIKAGHLTAEKNYYLRGVQDKEGHHFASLGLHYFGTQAVQGIVKHEDREHKQLKLYEVGTKPKDRKWYEAYHNVQVQSFTADGLVD